MTMGAIPPEYVERAILSARAVLSAKEKEQSNDRAMKRWAELVEAGDMAQLEHGIAIFETAPSPDQWEAFRQFTLTDDLYRCLLSDYYLDEFKEGRAGPPVSPMWADFLLVGGFHIYEEWRKRFVRLWNREVKNLGLEELQKPAQRAPY